MGVELTRCQGGPRASMPRPHVPDTVQWMGCHILCSALLTSRGKWPAGVCRFLDQSLRGLFIKQVERELSKGFRVVPDSQNTVL